MYASLTLVALLALSVLTRLQAAQITAGTSVWVVRLTERALIGFWLVWVAMLATALLRRSWNGGGLHSHMAQR